MHNNHRHRVTAHFQLNIIIIIIIIILLLLIIIIIIIITGTISKSFRNYVSSIPGNHEVRELQKTAVLCTENILRKC
jgi:flagellar basal body-associated protein FliL